MPVFNVTGEVVISFPSRSQLIYGPQVPDSSPLIAYTGSWNDTPKDTTDYKLYQNQTYHLSSQNVRSTPRASFRSDSWSLGRHCDIGIQRNWHLYIRCSQTGIRTSPNSPTEVLLTCVSVQDGYSVTLDGGSPFEASATAATAQYNVLLYSATALDVTMEHQVVLQNSQGSSQETSLDIDYMVITAGDGDLQYVTYPVAISYAH